MDVLKVSRDEDIGLGMPHWEGRSKVSVAAGGGGGGGEHSVKQFMNVKVKSSKEEVKVHAKNELVSEVKWRIFVVDLIAFVMGVIMSCAGELLSG